MIHKLLCLFGLHEWHFMPVDDGRTEYMRTCLWCLKQEHRKRKGDAWITLR